MRGGICVLAATICVAAPGISVAQTAPSTAQPVQPGPVAATPSQTVPVPESILAEGAAITVATDEDLSSQTNRIGDRFRVVVADDVIDRGVVVIPKGTTGYGEVTFRGGKGAFGRGGLLGIALRYLDLNGKRVLLDGRYREEGKDNGGAAGAAVFAVGIFGGFVTGKTSVIAKGRLLKAHTGEDIAFPAASIVTEPTSIVLVTSPAAAPATPALSASSASAVPATLKPVADQSIQPKTN